MKPVRLRRPTRLALLLTIAGALLVAGPVTSASAVYQKPPTGKWTFQNLFDDTKRGALALGKKGKATVIRKLVLVVGDDDREACGKRIKVAGKPKLRSFRSVNRRWAFARNPNGLFLPKAVGLKVDGKARRGRLIMLFDESGRLVNSATLEYRDCTLSFFAHKGPR